MMRNCANITIGLISLLLPLTGVSQLVAIEDNELGEITGEAGITIGIDYQTTQDLAFTPDQDGSATDSDADFYLLFGETNIDIEFDDLQLDIVNLEASTNAIQLTLPTNISLQDFTTGIIYMSFDNTASDAPTAITGPVATLPSSPGIFQLVATSAYTPSYYQSGGNIGLGASRYDLYVQDISTNSSGTATGTGNLKVLNWDDDGTTFLHYCSGGIPGGVVAYNGGCSDATYNAPGNLPSGGLVLGTGAARLEGGYKLNSPTFLNFFDPNFKALVNGLGHFGSASYVPTTFAAGGARDTRLLFSVDKAATVRMRMDLTQCDTDINSCRGPNALTLLGASGLYTVVDPAIALLDESGRVLDADSSSGPATPLYGTTNSDTTSSALLDVTLGPLYLSTAVDRRLGGLVIGAPIEQSLAAESEFAGTAYNTLSNRANIQLGGRINVFSN